MQPITFAPSATHPLAAALVGVTGCIVANETRDGVPWIVAEFEGYGTVCLPADQFEAP